MKVQSEKLVSLVEATEIMEKRKKKGDLGYEQQNTLDYLQEFCYLNKKKADALEKELKALDLKEEQIVSLTNLLPQKESVVRLVLSSDGGATPEQVKEVVKIMKKHIKPKK